MSLVKSQKHMKSRTILKLTQPFPKKGSWVASEEGLRMGELETESLRIQQLSQFALSDSLREKASYSLRKRSKPIDSQDENGLRKTGLKRESSTKNSSSGSVLVKVRSPRAKRSEKVGKRSQVVKPGLDYEEENGLRKENFRSERRTSNSRSGAVVVKVGSTRAKRSDEVSTGSQFVRPERASRLHSTILEEVLPKSGLGDAHQGDYKILDASFYECDALELAPKLLGKLIRRDDVILQITEVEAYRPGDSACHARVGETARTAPLFGPAGHAYVYLCYGLHFMLNVVADSIGVGAAVLIRACSPVAGLSSIQLRRGQVTTKPVLLTGPGKVGQALGLTTEWTSHPLYTAGGLEILDAPPPTNTLVGPRVGIDYAEPKDVAALWRFAIADSPWVSAPRAALRLLKPQ